MTDTDQFVKLLERAERAEALCLHAYAVLEGLGEWEDGRFYLRKPANEQIQGLLVLLRDATGEKP